MVRHITTAASGAEREEVYPLPPLPALPDLDKFRLLSASLGNGSEVGPPAAEGDQRLSHPARPGIELPQTTRQAIAPILRNDEMPPRPNVVSALRGLSIQPRSVARSTQIPTPCCTLRRYSGIAQQPPEPPNNEDELLVTVTNPNKATVPRIIEDTARAVFLKQGLKFPPPVEQIKRKTHHHRERYDSVVDQMTKQIMRDGKLSKAQRHMAMVLNFLQTSPPPRTNPSKPLAPGSPRASHLPLDPTVYLQVAIDSVAPLIRVRSLKGMAGGGAALDVPFPLNIKQRRRTAIKWVLDIVNKKQSTVSGREMFAYRLSQEIINIVQGSSPVWTLRQNVHKLGTTARANLKAPALRKKGQQSQAF
ncbi:ribosomal protein S7 [Zalerion maritima]|uniref:Small ribosomal subunit protein uS7m n=1 Tax=Zalerion maritima TaxID=339359 RepID=A0AAD5RZL1_9PEZI|nr:ribosomal protein S7 [Zalerion maritima]